MKTSDKIANLYHARHKYLIVRTVGWLILANLALVTVFYAVRVPYMNEDHYRTIPERPLSASRDAFYVSVMTQSTIGVADIVPISWWSIVLTCAQALSTFAIYVYVGLVFLMTAV